MFWQRGYVSFCRLAVLFLPCLGFAQSSLNVSHDLVPLGIAASNMVSNQPALDSGPLLFQAVEYAQQHHIPLVIADPGVYYFLSLQNANWHLQLEGLNDMTIDLQGSDLIFSHPLQEALYLGYNMNTVFQNFTVDYQPLPFTQVRVVSVDPSHAQIQYAVQPGWQDPSTFNSAPPGTIIEVHMFRNGQPAFGTRRMAAQASIAGNRLTIIPYDIIPTPQNIAMIRPGDIAVVAMRTTNATIVADRCVGCTLRNISIYSGTTAAVSTFFSTSSTLERIYMIPKPGTDRLVSAFGINEETPGPNAHIRLSRAIRSMDDGFGLFNWVTGTVQSQVSSRTLVVAGPTNTALSYLVSVPNGSPVVFELPVDGSILASAVVVSQTAGSTSAQPYLVTLTFDRDLPNGVVGSYMYTTDPNLRGANSVMERNMVQSSSSCCTGIDMGGWASNSTVHGNYIRRSAFSAIMGNQHLEQNFGDDRTTPLVNVTFSNNVIDGANLSPVQILPFYSLGAIQISTLRSDQNGITNLMPTSPHQNITIANNFIADAGRSAVWVGNTAGGSVSGNYFLNPGDRPDLPDGIPTYNADATLPLVIDSTSNAITAANNAVDQNSLSVFVTDTAFRELAAYPPAGTIRLNAYGVGQLSGLAVTFTDADGNTAPLTIQNTTPHALDVQIPLAAALGGAFLTLTSGATKYFGTLFVDSQDNIPAVNGCTYETSLSSSSVPAGASNLPLLVVTQAGCSYQVQATDPFVNPGASTTGTAVIQVSFAANTGPARSATIEIAGQPITLTQGQPTLSLSRASLNFGISGSLVTSTQSVNVGFTNGVGVSWTASSNQPNITVSSSTGSGNGTFQVNAAPGPSGTITVTAAGSANSPLAVQVNIATVTPAPPFGSFDTPLDKTTGVVGAIPVTGWALDNIEVTHVDILREPVVGEPSGNLVFIGTAVFSSDARPDVQAMFPALPFQYRAGWGYQMLTNFLPNASGSGAPGNGTYKLHAIAFDKAGKQTDLGTRTITVDNAHAAKPFGTIDTPGQGGTISGSAFINFGWALTPQPALIPTDGSTITVVLDGVSMGHPVYNNLRSDIASLFPGYGNSGGAVGYYYLDSTKLTNGVHTISWNAFDNQARGEGLGSRYFNVLNTGGPVAAPEDVVPDAAANEGVRLRHGLDVNSRLRPIALDSDGCYTVTMEEVGHIEVHLGAARGNLLVEGETHELPIGSTLKGGIFYWQPGPGFLGDYAMQFERPDGTRIPLLVKIVPKRY
jgi:hypothetical protein